MHHRGMHHNLSKLAPAINQGKLSRLSWDALVLGLGEALGPPGHGILARNPIRQRVSCELIQIRQVL